MNDLKALSRSRLSSRVREFVSEASDLYVGFLTEGKESLATSLLSGLVLVLVTLEKVSKLSPGPERTREMRHAAAVFHKLSVLIFVSSVYDEDDEHTDLRTLHAYDSAADLSGLLAAAARRA